MFTCLRCPELSDIEAATCNTATRACSPSVHGTRCLFRSCLLYMSVGAPLVSVYFLKRHTCIRSRVLNVDPRTVTNMADLRFSKTNNVGLCLWASGHLRDCRFTTSRDDELFWRGGPQHGEHHQAPPRHRSKWVEHVGQDSKVPHSSTKQHTHCPAPPPETGRTAPIQNRHAPAVRTSSPVVPVGLSGGGGGGNRLCSRRLAQAGLHHFPSSHSLGLHRAGHPDPLDGKTGGGRGTAVGAVGRGEGPRMGALKK